MAITLSHPAFVAGGDIPRQFTCDAMTSPSPGVEPCANETGSFSLITDDLDAERHVHVLGGLCYCRGRINLPSGTRSDAVGVSGRNTRGDIGYIGPCPPSGTHRYVFHLFALDIKPSVSSLEPP
jgi:phosphatidylethanolamine-binding protein (PEBP) family uncharacterized protein